MKAVVSHPRPFPADLARAWAADLEGLSEAQQEAMLRGLEMSYSASAARAVREWLR